MKQNSILPREKAIKFGINTLSDSELFAIILGSGSKYNSVFSIAEKLQNYLAFNSLKTIEAKELQSISGIGEAKSISICAALEFSRRYLYPEKRKITQPKELIPYISHYSDRKQEHFIVATVSGANEIIRVCVVTIGILNKSLIHPREVFAEAIKDRAAAIFVAHNHPSGNLNPSKDDLDVTFKMKAAGEILGIPLLDHIIFCYNDYFSFIENKIF